MTSSLARTRARTHIITGEPDQVWAALTRAREDGRLVEITKTELLADDQLRAVTLLRTPRKSISPWIVVTAKVLAVLTAVAAAAALIWAVTWAIITVVAAVSAAIVWLQLNLMSIVIGVVVIGGLLLFLFSGSAKCVGLHCGGCKG